MPNLLLDWLFLAEQLIRRNIHWMTWNLFLAFIPFLLSGWLFYRRRSRSVLWWIVLLVFIAFLPNAPYVLTDIIHLVYDIRSISSIWVITLILVPQYLLFMLAGFEAYVLSLINLGHYLKRQRLGQFVILSELVLHLLSAIGIYLGRFERFNSWDFVTQPNVVINSMIQNLLDKRPVLVMTIAFMIITALYWLMKQITLGLVLRWRFKADISSAS